jgi:hypothetical protein
MSLLAELPATGEAVLKSRSKIIVRIVLPQFHILRTGQKTQSLQLFLKLEPGTSL